MPARLAIATRKWLLPMSIGIAAVLGAGMASAAYPKVVFKNWTKTTSIAVTVNYLSCKSDTFNVGPGETASPTDGRGACLISSITGTGITRGDVRTLCGEKPNPPDLGGESKSAIDAYRAAKEKYEPVFQRWFKCQKETVTSASIAPYTSSGTSYSTFGLIDIEGGTRIHRVDGNGTPLDTGGGYPQVSIKNNTNKSVKGTVEYASAFCKNDNFSVGVGNTWTGPSRGVCLVTKITTENTTAARPPVMVGGYDYASQTYSNLYYWSSGTSYSKFGIFPTTLHGTEDYIVHRVNAQGNPDVGSSYPMVLIENRTALPIYGHLEMLGTACKDWNFTIPAADLKGKKTNQKDAGGAYRVTYPNGTYWMGDDRGVCLVKEIHANVGGKITKFKNYPVYKSITTPGEVTGGEWAQTYNSSGTSYGSFAVAAASGGYKVFRTDGGELVTTSGEDPGFMVNNKTEWDVEVSLDQAGCLYHEMIPAGKSKRWVTGSVWFTVNAQINYDGVAKISDWDCAKPIAEIVGDVVLTVATGGVGGVGLAAAKAGATAAAKAALKKATGIVLKECLTNCVGKGVAKGLASMTAKQVGEALIDESQGSLAGQYAGYAWPFRSTQVPTYDITGGPTVTDGVIEAKSLCITKTNSVGNEMMKGSSTKSCS